MVSIAIISFAKFKKTQSRASMSAVMNYAMKSEKTLFEDERLVSGLNCLPQTVYHEFINTKLLYGKDSGRMYYHMVQSFPKGEDVPPRIAHEMAVKLAAHFKDYEVLVCTHTDRDHIHSHFIINSVSYENGRKFHISTPELEPIRQLNDRLCMQYGFEVCKPKPKHEHTKSMSTPEYHAAAKGESWKLRLMNTIDECMKHAGSKTQFIELMEFEGYAVKWTDSRKSITYTTPTGMKCRDDRLHESKYLKERMELELRIREEIIAGGVKTAEQIAATTRAVTAADVHAFASDEGETGQSFLQPTGDYGRSDRNADTGEPLAWADHHSTNTDGQAAHTGGACENQSATNLHSADTFTGWEAEREIFFSAAAPTATLGMDTAVGSDTLDIAGIGSSVVQLGRAMERLGSSVLIKDATTQKVVHERKKGVGQKEDDHSGYDFGMKM